MLIRLKRFKSVVDLNLNSARLNNRERCNFKIAIIDDEDFYYKEQLSRLGFNITKYDDIQDLNMLASYDLIISDIKGVGKHFDSEFEGAFLLSELKKMYPYKSFAAYTGSAYDPRITEFLSGILVIKKDYSIDEWTSAIDSLIRNVGDPKQIWIKIRRNLLDMDVSLLQLTYLEDEFVDRVINNKGFNGFPSNRELNKIPVEVKSWIYNIATSVFTKLLLP